MISEQTAVAGAPAESRQSAVPDQAILEEVPVVVTVNAGEVKALDVEVMDKSEKVEAPSNRSQALTEPQANKEDADHSIDVAPDPSVVCDSIDVCPSDAITACDGAPELTTACESEIGTAAAVKKAAKDAKKMRKKAAAPAAAAPAAAALPPATSAAAFAELAGLDSQPEFPRLPGTPELKPHAPSEAASAGAPTFSYATMAKMAAGNETLVTQPSPCIY